jgi:DNA-binding NarL/FixJ family response regulator
MSRRVLVAGGSEEHRAGVIRVVDAAFDVDIEERADLAGVLRLLPNKGLDLVVVLSGSDDLPGLDVVRFVHEHALHRDVPLVFVSSSEDERAQARSAGALRALGSDAADVELRRAVSEALGIG